MAEYPKELNSNLKEVLGLPNFRCAALAEMLRRSGEHIAYKAEDEQAHVIHWLIGFVLEHGDDWRAVATKAINETGEIQRERKP